MNEVQIAGAPPARRIAITARRLGYPATARARKPLCAKPRRARHRHSAFNL